MKKQSLVWSIVLSVCRLAHGQNGAPSDIEKMQGKWTPTTLYIDAQLMEEEHLPAFSVTFEMKTMTLEVGPFAFARVDFSLDPSKTPKAFDYVVPKGPDKGKTVYGIYELEGDKLKISIADYGTGRPKDYSIPEAKSERVVMCPRRAK